ncbi:MAG: SDR family NAD(P)-dependent oxidoreductase [Rhodothermales bacterium]|nr:SDR family NAD(P)-dependent oxidoreductase [Rhodothermales bacterium]
MTPILGDKITFVTGVASGIGQAAARVFAEAGATVVGVDLDIQQGQATIDAIRAGGADAAFFPADVTQASHVDDAVRQAVARFGRIDAAFNVVGASGRRHGDGPVHACTEAGWDWTMDVNLKSMYLCCKYLVAQMLAQGRGSIVNLASVLGMVGGDEDFGTHAYAASKGAVISLTRSIASYYAPNGIRANVLCPGLIATAMSRRAQENDHIKTRLKTLQPLTGDFGSAEDVARAALYLASDQAAFVTGAVLTVDGGWTVR